jgi:CelD/BcsL family acetyltransferase involved in cellulose biosynthesis
VARVDERLARTESEPSFGTRTGREFSIVTGVGESTAGGATGLFAVVAADDPRWETWWAESPGREVFAHPAWARLNAAGGRPLAAIWDGEGGRVLYPFVLYETASERATDVRTPYGYGGPVFWGADRAAAARAFWPRFDAWAAEAGVVAEVVRFSLFDEDLLAYPGAREERLRNAVRRLDLEPEELWMDVAHKVRKNVKKAGRAGVQVGYDPAGADLDEFLRVYAATMTRRKARPDYRFPRAYFERLLEELPGSVAFFHARHGGRLVATELVLISERNVYSFLGGTDESAYELRPNDLLKWEIVLWAREAGKERYVLGGGSERDDGVFRYKLSFAPRGEVPFFIGTRILRPDMYERLVDERRRDPAWKPRPGFFPLYRA